MSVDSAPILQHVAIIMDGNGRWAKKRGLPRTAGHRQGIEALRRTVKAAMAQGVRYVTLFGFSSENWSRPQMEVAFLVSMLRRYLRAEAADLHAQGVRLRIIGERERFPHDIVQLMNSVEAQTAGNDRLHLTLALSYGGRQDIVQSFKQMICLVQRGELKLDDIDTTSFGRFLSTGDLPDPDLIIRTSGEIRVSNFLLWQMAYAEMVFMDVLWPDFGEAELASALTHYSQRDRRFGVVVG